MDKFTAQLIAWRIFGIKIILLWFKNAIAGGVHM
jgi:hypothetical protein